MHRNFINKCNLISIGLRRSQKWGGRKQLATPLRHLKQLQTAPEEIEKHSDKAATIHDNADSCATVVIERNGRFPRHHRNVQRILCTDAPYRSIHLLWHPMHHPRTDESKKLEKYFSLPSSGMPNLTNRRNRAVTLGGLTDGRSLYADGRTRPTAFWGFVLNPLPS